MAQLEKMKTLAGFHVTGAKQAKTRFEAIVG